MVKRLLTTASCFLSLALGAQVRLPRLVADSMILQRDKPVRIWGWASPGEKVSVGFRGKTYRGTGDRDGNWAVELPAMAAGGPYDMVIRGRNEIQLHDILIGDVWICSGQSNMVHQIRLHNVRYASDIAMADFSSIRQFWIPTTVGLAGPAKDLSGGGWKAATGVNVLDFSAVAYFFAKELYERYHVPIGIINASVGGSPIEAWISAEGLKDIPAIGETVARNRDTAYTNGIVRRAVAAAAALPPVADEGMTGVPWYDPGYVAKGWKPIGIPGYWEDQGLTGLDGIVWYRREIDVPAVMCGRDAKVFLGRIVDADYLYINGKLVGSTGYLYPQRRYAIPADLLKPGKNIFVIRVINHSGKGGFVPDKPYALMAGGDTIDLKGQWSYKVGGVEIPAAAGGGGAGFNVQNQPTALYNGMLAPVVGYAVKGFCWYQGESNVGRAGEYAKLQRALIGDWRAKWGAGAGWCFVQLPGYGDYHYTPGESSWADLREAQASSLDLPGTAMAVAIDLGEWNDIHPDRKKEVGQRLALAAEKISYDDTVVYSGPVYESMNLLGDTLALQFGSVAGGLITNDGEEPHEFAIAGADRKWVWAHAKIEGNRVLVWNETVKAPVLVRYAWADDPVNPNLYNTKALPAAPFQATAGSTLRVTQ